MKPSKTKSRTFRRRTLKLPSGKHTVHYSKRKPKVAHCAICGAPLLGVPRARPYDHKHMSKTEKRPERPYGGMICSKCMRKLMKERAYQIEL